MTITSGDVVLAAFVAVAAVVVIAVCAVNRRAGRRRELARSQAEALAIEWRETVTEFVAAVADGGNVTEAVRRTSHISKPDRAVWYLPGHALHDAERWDPYDAELWS